MSKSHRRRIFPFSTEGRFLGFAPDSKGKLKFLHLVTSEGDRFLKLPKELRSLFTHSLTPGDWLRVKGERQIDRFTGEETWVLYQAIPQPASEPGSLQSAPVLKLSELQPAQCSVLVCQKSDCQKRGAAAVMSSLKASLKDHSQGDQIRVQSVGCLKNCKAGPNVVFMPDKARYCKVSPTGIPTLVERHFPIEPLIQKKEPLTPELSSF